ncbi:hypothetical protein QYZ87_09690 [Porphyromonadaceae bacterium W3.11]|nr:hypothetical protein [Porphyromonadaceae bacterium W3.11]
MALTDRDKRRIISSGVWIFTIALILWAFSFFTNNRKKIVVDDHLINVGVDLFPHEFGIDSIGLIRGNQMQLMTILLPDDSLEWVPFNTRGEAIQALRNREIQIYATSLPYSARNNYPGITATEWLYHSRFSLLYHSENNDWESKFTGNEEVIVTISEEDKVAKIMLENLSELSYPAIKIDERNESPLQLGILLVKGDIDYLVCNSKLATSIAEMDSTLHLSKNITIDTQQVWLVNEKDTLLLKRLNKRILEKRNSPEWQKIFKNN